MGAEIFGVLPSGSYLTRTHPTADFSPEEVASAVAATKRGSISFTARSQAEVTAFFDGLDLVDPGVVPILAWEPEGAAPDDPHAAYYYGAIGRKP